MTKSVYVLAPEGLVGKSSVALGTVDALSRHVSSVGVFRPIIRTDGRDTILETLLALPKVNQSYESAYGVPYSAIHSNPEEAMSQIIARYEAIKEKYDAVVILGSDYSDVFQATEFSFNVEVAANLNAPILLVMRGNNKTPEDLRQSINTSLEEIESHHISAIGVLATRLGHEMLDDYKAALEGLDLPIVAAMPENISLAAPSVRQQFNAAEASVLHGTAEQLDTASHGVIITGMTLPNVLDALIPNATVIVAADRVDLLPGLLLAHQSGGFPQIASILLVGGFRLPSSIRRLLDSAKPKPPIGFTRFGTFTVAERVFGLEGSIASSEKRAEMARTMFQKYVDGDKLVEALDVSTSDVRTPLMFEYQLQQKARSHKRAIVLPESEDDRILQSAHIVLARNIADVILLGDQATITRRAQELNLTIGRAKIVNPADPALLDKFAHEYARLRSKKGVTYEQARDMMADTAYFGTMMVHFGLADGMVSGARHTTANTIRPALEFIKTKPGFKVVSGAFLMCLPDRVLVFGDCAVNPNPTAEQLADIAISSARTAAAFGIDPRIAMLSYSTGTSGSGEDVDEVREATEIVRERAPELLVEGPIQFDAAMDAEVARTKLPDSQVAGKATVFIFPDLNTGNNTYKAVQRTANALAIGPVLQGLNKPVNDLSRGALVDDIVNTVAITAIQAQEEPTGTPTKLALEADGAR
ncbi:MAG: phosphate acetyltransferase [Propionibacteriaceae bacterium]|jgi:phosphate acetyltransferase|nr:phosphate acetyltransferase [Propionibacteriaceae bacterium]